MSVPEGARGEGKFSLVMKAEELAAYTMQITANDNVFMPEYQRALTDNIITQAKNAYLLIREANEYRVSRESDDYMSNRRKRARSQNLAVECLKRLLYLIGLAQRVFHLSSRRVKYWGAMVIDIRDRTRKWMESDMRRYSFEE